MKKRRIIYLVITILFIVASIGILKHTDLSNNVIMSKSIGIILILFLMRISYGCTLYILKQYQNKKYSYSIIMNLGLMIFINLNILRLINLLIVNWNVMNMLDLYNNTLDSFSYFAMLTLPCISILAIYSIITNIILIKKEGFKPYNLLGILLGIIAIFGLIGSQSIYIVTSKLILGKEQMAFKKFVDVLINASLSYFYSLIIATLYCNVKAAKHIPSYDKDFVIILGSQIKKDGTLTPLLKARVDKAIEFGKKQYDINKKAIYYIPSGGKGNDEVIAEAKAIEKYLLSQGIDKKHILVEDKSKNTIENMKYSNKIIKEMNKDAKISFATTNYHVFRSGVIANDQGIDCEGMGSKTRWYFYTNALIREFVANIVSEWKRHLGLLLVMNITTAILLYIGYYYNLITMS